MALTIHLRSERYNNLIMGRATASMQRFGSSSLFNGDEAKHRNKVSLSSIAE